MSEATETIQEDPQGRSASPSVAPASSPEQDAPRRSAGNRVFDLLVYPSIAFGAVFAFSIWALHTTKYGSGRSKEMFVGINKWVAEKLEHLPFFKHMTDDKRIKEAGNYASIFVSFAAGTLLISPIKWFEDKRSDFSKLYDRVMGTTPKDPTHYAKEPRQSWKSIMGGRALTFASVMALGTAIGEKRTAQVTEGVVNFVARQWKKFNPAISEARLTKVKQWTEVSTFEAFYTALCTVLVYTISRSLARFFNRHEQSSKPVPAAPAAVAQSSATEEEQTPAKSYASALKGRERNVPEKSQGFSSAVEKSRLNSFGQRVPG